MWSLNPTSAVSIVQKAEDIERGTLTVRGRDKQSIAAFMSECGVPTKAEDIELDIATDYPYRTIVDREIAAQWAYDKVMAIDYSNFKNEAKRVRGAHYAGVLGRVWSALLELEDKATRKAIKKRFPTTPLLGGASGGGYGSLFAQTLLADVDQSDDQAEFERLCNVVADAGIHALTDAEYAFWDGYNG